MHPELNSIIQSIEAKQIAQQEAFQARYVVMQAKEEKKQKIVSAEGEAARYDLCENLISSHNCRKLLVYQYWGLIFSCKLRTFLASASQKLITKMIFQGISNAFGSIDPLKIKGPLKIQESILELTSEKFSLNRRLWLMNGVI